MIEIYKDVIDYEGLYKVSNFGNIKNNKDKILKSSLYKNGYLMINLCKYGIVKRTVGECQKNIRSNQSEEYNCSCRAF